MYALGSDPIPSPRVVPVPEVHPDFARSWVEFADPANAEQIIKADLTWLTSRWSCIFGRGCPGIYDTRPDDGCCTLGAHLSDEEDRDRVQQWASRLTPQMWQYHDVAVAQGAFRVEPPDEDGASEGDAQLATRVVDGACIFLNRPGFSAGTGCALHLLADEQSVSFVETKPDVCWQLPLRRDFEWREDRDDTQRLVITLTEYTRSGWGPGGHDLSWYCSGNSEAHIAADPLYLRHESELVALIGKPAADVLAGHCAAHEDTNTQRRKRHLPLIGVHPADPPRPIPD